MDAGEERTAQVTLLRKKWLRSEAQVRELAYLGALAAHGNMREGRVCEPRYRTDGSRCGGGFL